MVPEIITANSLYKCTLYPSISALSLFSLIAINTLPKELFAIHRLKIKHNEKIISAA